MRFASGMGLFPTSICLMLTLSLTGCFGTPDRLNPMYEYYEKASKIDDFDKRDSFLKSLSASEICAVVILSRKNPSLNKHAISVAERKGNHGLYGGAGCM